MSGDNGNSATATRSGMQMTTSDFMDNLPVFSGVPDVAPPAHQGQPQGQQMMPANLSGAEAMIASGMTLQRTQTPYTTAVQVQKPRDLDRVVKNVLHEARYAKDNFYYAWELKGRNGGRVEGASIGLAYAVARAYGNCVVDLDHKLENGVDVFTGRFVDLETGYTTTRIFRQKNNPLGGGYNAARKDDMMFQAAQSKALRNVILAGVPRWLVDAAVKEAKSSTCDAIEQVGVAESRAKLEAFFAPYGVNVKMLESYTAKLKSEWEAKDVANLRGVAKSLMDGQTTPDDHFDMSLADDGKEKEAEPAKKPEKPAEKPAPTEPAPEPAPEPEKAPAATSGTDQGHLIGAPDMDPMKADWRTLPEAEKIAARKHVLQVFVDANFGLQSDAEELVGEDMEKWNKAHCQQILNTVEKATK